MTRGFLPPPPSGRGSPGARCGRQEEKTAGVQQAFPFHPCYFLLLSPKRKKKKKKKARTGLSGGGGAVSGLHLNSSGAGGGAARKKCVREELERSVHQAEESQACFREEETRRPSSQHGGSRCILPCARSLARLLASKEAEFS